MIAKLLDKILSFLNGKLDVMKLSIIERISVILGFFMFTMVGMIMTVAVIIFLGIGLGEYFAVITGSEPLGYLIVSGVYILLLVLILAFKKRLNKWFAGLFISMLTSNDDEEEEPNHPNRG